MLRRLRVWWIIITQMGPAAKAGEQISALIRYYVLKTLGDLGLFDYLKEPRAYGQILAEFGFVDGEYTRELLEILVTDERNVVKKDGELYQVNPTQPLPTFEEVWAILDEGFRGFVSVTEGMMSLIPARLRAEPIELSDSLEAPGRQLLDQFNEALGHRMYGAMRNAAFALLLPQERAWLRGKTLLEVGCGSGRETADIWLQLGGDVRITATDSVPGMVELAEQTFPSLLDRLTPNHPPLTDSNRPTFQQAYATNLSTFEDDTFDAAFHVQMLHWTPDPHRAVREIVRVVKPGGLIFGAQTGKERSDRYMNISLRTNENCHGFFWLEEYRRWYADYGMELEIATPAGIFRVRKPM